MSWVSLNGKEVWRLLRDDFSGGSPSFLNFRAVAQLLWARWLEREARGISTVVSRETLLVYTQVRRSGHCLCVSSFVQGWGNDTETWAAWGRSRWMLWVITVIDLSVFPWISSGTVCLGAGWESELHMLQKNGAFWPLNSKQSEPLTAVLTGWPQVPGRWANSLVGVNTEVCTLLTSEQIQ